MKQFINILEYFKYKRIIQIYWLFSRKWFYNIDHCLEVKKHVKSSSLIGSLSPSRLIGKNVDRIHHKMEIWSSTKEDVIVAVVDGVIIVVVAAVVVVVVAAADSALDNETRVPPTQSFFLHFLLCFFPLVLASLDYDCIQHDAMIAWINIWLQ